MDQHLLNDITDIVRESVDHARETDTCSWIYSVDEVVDEAMLKIERVFKEHEKKGA